MKKLYVATAMLAVVLGLGVNIASAQPRRMPPPPRPVHVHHHRESDLASVSRIIGAVAIIANANRPVHPVVVTPPPPVVIHEKPVVVIEKKPQVVVLEQPKQVYPVPAMKPSGYVEQLGTQFSIRRMQIPNFAPFDAAVLLNDPPIGSPLYRIGLRKGDAISRVNEVKIVDMNDFDYAQGETSFRYIKNGSTTVQSATVIVPVAP